MSEARPSSRPPVPTGRMDVELLETGWLMSALWKPAGAGDPIARSLYLKMKRAALSMGVVWYYGDPWPEASGRVDPAPDAKCGNCGHRRDCHQPRGGANDSEHCRARGGCECSAFTAESA